MRPITKNQQPITPILTLFLFLFPNVSRAVDFAGGTGEPNDPYRIATAEQLIGLGEDPNLYYKHFVLVADIDLTGRVFAQAVIAPGQVGLGRGRPGFDGDEFLGLLNGDGHKIRGLAIHGQTTLGLIGGLGAEAVVLNLGLEVVDVNGIGDAIGGLVGYTNGFSIITNSFWDIEASGLTQSDGGTGQSTVQMQDINTFLNTEWDFNDIWMICPEDYPRLQWEGIQCDSVTVGQ